jgi:hypothetical protein
MPTYFDPLRRISRRSHGLVVSVAVLISLFVLPSVVPYSQAVASTEKRSWSETITKIPAPGPGCFTATFPSLNWHPVPCEYGNPDPLVVSNLNDSSARSPSGTIIGFADGLFHSVHNLTSEFDSKTYVENDYTLQVNSQYGATTFQCNTAYTGNKNGECWQQFVFENRGSTKGLVFIEYWLIDWLDSYLSCPSTQIPNNGTYWSIYGSSCYASSAMVETPAVSATKLGNLSLAGSSDFSGSTKDEASLTNSVTGKAYTVSVTDNVLQLSKYWQIAEFNVFGYGGGSTAQFQYHTSINVYDQIETESGNVITPHCSVGGYTGEKNNLHTYLTGTKSCTVLSNNFMSFIEDKT